MNKFHRFLSLVLCFTFLLSFAFSPIRVLAVDPFIDTAYAIVGGVLVDAFSEGAKLVASVLASASSSAGKIISVQGLKQCSAVVSFISGGVNASYFKTLYSQYEERANTSGSKMALDSKLITIIRDAYLHLYGNSISVPTAGTEIFVPPDSLWTQAELITFARLTSDGFHDFSEVNENILAGNKISWQSFQQLIYINRFLLNDLTQLLSSNFSALASEISSLDASLGHLISSLNDSVVNMSSTLQQELIDMSSILHSDLSEINSVYSTYGDSIVNGLASIDPSVLKSDLVDLKTLTSTYGNAFDSDFKSVISQLKSVNSNLSNDDSLSYLKTMVENDLVAASSLENTINSVNLTLDGVNSDLSRKFDELSTSFNDSVSGFQADYNSMSDSLFTTTDDIHHLLDIYIAPDLLSINTWSETINDTLTSNFSSIKSTLFSFFSPTFRYPDTSTLDDAESLKIPLYSSIASGFDRGNIYFGFTNDFLADDLNGFLVAVKIFNEFADISFFQRLIVISCSIGLVGALLGMALYSQSCSIAQRRRDEAAQARSHSRMERSSAA